MWIESIMGMEDEEAFERVAELMVDSSEPGGLGC
jgi:hypothetical protein